MQSLDEFFAQAEDVLTDDWDGSPDAMNTGAVACIGDRERLIDELTARRQRLIEGQARLVDAILTPPAGGRVSVTLNGRWVTIGTIA